MSKHFTGHYYTDAALKSAYRDLCLKHHPDRANRVMQEINGEYEILKEQLRRDGAAGWNVPKEIRQDRPRESTKQNVKPSRENHARNVEHIEKQRAQNAIDAQAEALRHADDMTQFYLNQHVMPLNVE